MPETRKVGEYMVAERRGPLWMIIDENRELVCSVAKGYQQSRFFTYSHECSLTADRHRDIAAFLDELNEGGGK